MPNPNPAPPIVPASATAEQQAQLMRRAFEALGIGGAALERFSLDVMAEAGGADGSTFRLNRPIGANEDVAYWGDYLIVPDHVSAWLDSATGDLCLQINSPGGVYFSGLEIHNLLLAYPRGRITVLVTGIAGSAASCVAMAGDEVVMGAGAIMMIHRVLTIGMGNVNDFKTLIEELEKFDAELANIYAKKCGMSVDEIMAFLDKDTFFNASEAVEIGLADRPIRSGETFASGRSLPAIDKPPPVGGQSAARAARMAAMMVGRLGARPQQ